MRTRIQLAALLALSMILVVGCTARPLADQVTDAKVAYVELTNGILAANDVGLVPESAKPIIKSIDQEAFTALQNASADAKAAATQPSKVESAVFYLKQVKNALARFQTYRDKFVADTRKVEWTAMLESIILLSKILQVADVGMDMVRKIGVLIHKAANNKPYTKEETDVIDKLVLENHDKIQAM